MYIILLQSSQLFRLHHQNQPIHYSVQTVLRLAYQLLHPDHLCLPMLLQTLMAHRDHLFLLVLLLLLMAHQKTSLESRMWSGLWLHPGCHYMLTDDLVHCQVHMWHVTWLMSTPGIKSKETTLKGIRRIILRHYRTCILASVCFLLYFVILCHQKMYSYAWFHPKTSVVTPHKNNACLYLRYKCLCVAFECVAVHHHLDANDADMAKLLLSFDITTEGIVK